MRLQNLRHAMNIVRMQNRMEERCRSGDLLRQISQKPDPLRTEIDDIRRNVPVPHPFIDRFDGNVEPFLTRPQGRFGQLAFGEIGMRPEKPDFPPVRFFDKGGPCTDPTVGTCLLYTSPSPRDS